MVKAPPHRASFLLPLTIILIFAALMLAYHAARTPAELDVYYVSPDGSDHNPGTLDAPFQTLRHAVSRLEAGKTLYIRAGTYAEALENTIPGGDSWDRPVTIAAYPGELPVLAPVDTRRVLYFNRPTQHYIIIDGLILDGARIQNQVVKISGGAHHIRILNSEIKNAPGQGIHISQWESQYNEFINVDVHHNGLVDGVPNDHVHGIYIQTSHNTVRGSRFWSNGGQGVQIRRQSGFEQPVGNVVEGSRIYDQGRCVIVFDALDTTIANNVISGCSIGIQLNYDTANTRIWNNTIVGNIRGIELSRRSAAASLINNIIADNAEYGVRALLPQAVSDMQYNLITGNGADFVGEGIVRAADNLIGADYPPRFRNPDRRDYSLRRRSAAIDAGISLPDITTDILGTPRPFGGAVDLGAYEFPRE